MWLIERIARAGRSVCTFREAAAKIGENYAAEKPARRADVADRTASDRWRPASGAHW